MQPRFVSRRFSAIGAFIVIALAIIGAVALAALPSLWPARATAATNFDPLFATNTICGPARAGAPPLLAHLVAAQAQPETRPFTPGQAASVKPQPNPGNADPPPLYTDLGKLHVPITTDSKRAQAYFDQGIRLTFAFNHARQLWANNKV